MATQNNMTKQPSQPQAAASRAASAQAHDMDALDKLAARKAAQPQAEKAAEVANADAQAVAENAAPAQVASAEGAVTADAAAAGGVAAEAGAGTAAAGLSPLAIGGGVLGLAVVAAAAGGGGSGGSNGPASAPLAVKPPVSNVPADTQQPAAPSTPAAEKPPVAEAPTTSPAAETPAAQAPAAETPANPPAAQPAPQKPVQTVTTGPAVAQGEPGAPKVAETGETKLSNLKTVFENSAGEKTPVKYVQITHIQASESEHPNARSVRYGDEGPKQTPSADHDADVQGIHAVRPFAVRALPAEGQQAQGDAAKGGKTVLTAYEVIESKTPMTLAEAKAHAEKLGGKLLSVDDQKELDWLNENLQGLGHQGENNDNSKAAWIGSNKLHEGNAMITTGTDDTGHKPETIAQGAEAKLSRFVIEYDNYQAPLTLNGKPVQEGQIINAEDFDKLVWNSTYSQSGAIRFQAVDSNDPKTAKPLPNTQPHNVSITESPEVKQPTAPAQPAPAETNANAQQGGQATQGSDKQPVKDAHEGDAEHKGDTEHKADPQPAEHLPQYQAQHPVKVAHDATAKLDPAIFKGSDSDHPAGAVKILDVKPGTLKLDGQNVEANQVITADQFEKLSWDASTSKGGEFRFIAVRPEEGHAHYDAAKVQAQTISIDEAAAAPKYPEGDAHTVNVRQNIKQTLGEDLFKGMVADDAPAFIRIGKVNETADSNSAESALFVNKGRDAYTPLKEGSEVSFEDFKHIAWDSAQNNGGSFTFQALDHHKQPIAGSPLQTVTVHETPNLPNYGSDAKTVNVAHNANHHLNAALFKGVDGVTPAGVRILYIHGEDGYEGPVLKVGNDGAARSVSKDDVITMAEFDSVYLDANQFKGSASFKFVPVDEQGNVLQGADAANPVSREVKITEAGPQENSSQSPQTPAPEAGNTSQAGNASQPSGPSAGTGEVSRTEGAHSDTPQQSDSTSVQNQPSGTQSQTQGQTQGTVQGQAHSTSGEHAPTPPAASEGNSQSQGASSTQEGGPKTQETSGTPAEGGKQPQTVTTPPANGEQPPQAPATQQQEGKVSQTSAPEGSDPQLKNESHGEATGQHSEASQRALPLQLKDLLGHEELFGEASPTADNGHISYAPSSSLVSNLIDPLHEVPMV
jgi:similarity to cell wall-plasma membrane linker protein